MVLSKAEEKPGRPECFGVGLDVEAEACGGCALMHDCLLSLEDSMGSPPSGESWTASGLVASLQVVRRTAEILRDRAKARRGEMDHVELQRAVHRWVKERAGNPKIDEIKPGDVVVKNYKGQRHEVICRSDHWEFDGEKYSTLSAVVGAIAGYRLYKSSIPGNPDRWLAVSSGAKFFGLERRKKKAKEELL